MSGGSRYVWATVRRSSSGRDVKEGPPLAMVGSRTAGTRAERKQATRSKPQNQSRDEWRRVDDPRNSWSFSERLRSAGSSCLLPTQPWDPAHAPVGCLVHVRSQSQRHSSLQIGAFKDEVATSCPARSGRFSASCERTDLRTPPLTTALCSTYKGLPRTTRSSASPQATARTSKNRRDEEPRDRRMLPTLATHARHTLQHRQGHHQQAHGPGYPAIPSAGP